MDGSRKENERGSKAWRKARRREGGMSEGKGGEGRNGRKCIGRQREEGRTKGRERMRMGGKTSGKERQTVGGKG